MTAQKRTDLNSQPGSDERPKRKLWIDISVPVYNGMPHWPGDPEIRIERVKDMQQGDPNNVSALALGSHTGTHIDAPFHFIRSGLRTDQMALDQMNGAARVIEITNTRQITPEELAGQAIRRGERLLFKTLNSRQSWFNQPFREDFVAISREAAEFLSQKAPRVIGIDYLSVAGFRDDGIYIHQKLLGSGIWLIEGLDLSAVTPGRYNLYCLPLKLAAADGTPARAVLREL